jgi:hypothetical protein
MRIAQTKIGESVLIATDPSDYIYSSEWGTLKYFAKVNQNISFDASTGAIAASGVYTHSLGYYPYVEVFVRVYIGSPSGNYQYCPFAGAGATILYSATYKITETTIQLYGEINGFSSSVWEFDFLIFLYKNDIGL